MTVVEHPPMTGNVRAVFDAAPDDLRAAMLYLRSRIFEIAADLDIELEERLRWGQPACLAPKGSTLRIGLPKTGGFALYAHCATTLIRDFAAIAPTARIEGNRAVLFDTVQEARAQPLELLIAAALRFHIKR